MLFSVLLQAAAPAAKGLGGYAQLLFLGGFFVVFFLFFIRPQQQRQKKDRLFRENLKKGDRIVTAGGVYGKVVSVDGLSLLLEVDEGVKLRVRKVAVMELAEAGGEVVAK
jgi:preprotein translocase subunit YajC